MIAWSRLPMARSRFRHLVDLREHGAFPVRLVRAGAARGRLELLDALLHRDSFLGRESLELLVDRRGVLGGLLRVLPWAHGSSRLGEFICAAGQSRKGCAHRAVRRSPAWPAGGARRSTTAPTARRWPPPSSTLPDHRPPRSARRAPRRG